MLNLNECNNCLLFERIQRATLCEAPLRFGKKMLKMRHTSLCFHGTAGEILRNQDEAGISDI